MPVDSVTAQEIQTQVDAEVAYHAADAGIVASLPLIKNPTLVITSTNDLTNPPSNQASPACPKEPGYFCVSHAVCPVVSVPEGCLYLVGLLVPE